MPESLTRSASGMTARTQSLAMAVHLLPWRRRFWRRARPGGRDGGSLRSGQQLGRHLARRHLQLRACSLAEFMRCLATSPAGPMVRFGGNKGRIPHSLRRRLATSRSWPLVTAIKACSPKRTSLVVGAYSIAVRGQLPDIPADQRQSAPRTHGRKSRCRRSCHRGSPSPQQNILGFNMSPRIMAQLLGECLERESP